jgi:hypothetical protein
MNTRTGGADEEICINGVERPAPVLPSLAESFK